MYLLNFLLVYYWEAICHTSKYWWKTMASLVLLQPLYIFSNEIREGMCCIFER